MTDIHFEQFNPQQKRAVELAVSWYKGWADRSHRKQIFRLGGYAGTGKTTVARVIAELCGGQRKVVFIAPTGKAASRLRQKGCAYAKTMHSFIYNVRGEDEEGEPIFSAKGALDERPVLVIMDEASMVGEYDRKNLLMHGIPILEIGDPGQIPPVKDKQVFTLDSLDFVLEDIERNAGNIVKASMFIRQGKRLPVREYDDARVREGKPDDATMREHLGEDAVILCAFNSSREWMNERARRLLGFSGDIPQVGEKVVCTFNQHGYGWMNGEQGIIINYYDIPDEEKDDENEDCMFATIKSLTDGKERRIMFNPLSFSPDGEQKKAAQRSIGGVDYGYCLTVHKSQGSEWPRVMIIEETLRGVPYEQMMYTAVTRAIDQFTLYRQ
jgi:exodeoxyribonuclease-5